MFFLDVPEIFVNSGVFKESSEKPCYLQRFLENLKQILLFIKITKKPWCLGNSCQESRNLLKVMVFFVIFVNSNVF